MTFVGGDKDYLRRPLDLASGGGDHLDVLIDASTLPLLGRETGILGHVRIVNGQIAIHQHMSGHFVAVLRLVTEKQMISFMKNRTIPWHSPTNR